MCVISNSLRTLCVVDEVRGVAQLGNIVYVGFARSPIVRMYAADTLSLLGDGIHVEGMENPSDIVVCRDDRQLYVADEECCIWRVSADAHSYERWLFTPLTFPAWKLSLMSRRLLVTARSPPVLRQYNTTNS